MICEESVTQVWYQSFHRLLEYPGRDKSGTFEFFHERVLPGGKVTVDVTKEDKTSLGDLAKQLFF